MRRKKRVSLKGMALPGVEGALTIEYEGYLQKKSTTGKWQNRYFELVSDEAEHKYLRYYPDSGKDKLKGAIDMANLMECEANDKNTIILHIVEEPLNPAARRPKEEKTNKYKVPAPLLFSTLLTLCCLC
jgi:hypothetical protein